MDLIITLGHILIEIIKIVAIFYIDIVELVLWIVLYMAMAAVSVTLIAAAAIPLMEENVPLFSALALSVAGWLYLFYKLISVFHLTPM